MLNKTNLLSEEEIVDKRANLIKTSKNKLELIIDGQFNISRFAILDENLHPLWYEKEFNNYFDSQWDVELDVAKKAIWVASQIKELLNLNYLVLVLKTNCQALWYQNKWKQKDFILSNISCQKNIALIVKHIVGGTKNPADRYVCDKGFKKFDKSIDYKSLIKENDILGSKDYDNFFEINNK